VNAWRVDGETSRETLPPRRHAYISTLRKLGFEEEKGQLREMMTVARDRSAWGRKVEYYVRTSSGLIHESPRIERNTNDILTKA
jgi:hypothetical protein